MKIVLLVEGGTENSRELKAFLERWLHSREDQRVGINLVNLKGEGNFKTRARRKATLYLEEPDVLAVFSLVAFVKTFKLGSAPNFIGTLREIMVMNTGGGNTAVNFAYFAGLLSLAFSGCKQCKGRR